MELNGSVALVTGANRGLGRHFAEQLLERGAKVYAAARRPDEVSVAGAVPLRLDLADPGSVRAAARTAPDVTVLVNNAGVSEGTSLLTGDLDAVRRQMETNFFGTLAVSRAFAPVIEANGGGALLNVLSVLSWLHPAATGAYSASKAASWSMTDSLREELAPRGVRVAALHVGYMDTDMARHIPAENKADPASVAAQSLDGVEKDLPEILADDVTRQVKRSLVDPPTAA